MAKNQESVDGNKSLNGSNEINSIHNLVPPWP